MVESTKFWLVQPKIFLSVGIKLGPHAHTFAKEEDSIGVEAANRRSLGNTRGKGGSTTAKNYC